MRLIRANELSSAVYESKKNNPHKDDNVRRNHDHEHDHFMKMICDMPTVDAVPVVRCKDCKLRHTSEFCECRDEMAFCSDGEPKDADAK